MRTALQDHGKCEVKRIKNWLGQEFNDYGEGLVVDFHKVRIRWRGTEVESN